MSVKMAPNMWMLLTPFFPALSHAREIVFPSVAGYTTDQTVLGGYNDFDVSQGKFAGLTTYANLPYVHCLAPDGEKVEKFDIAILGAPFDTVSGISHCAVGLRMFGMCEDDQPFNRHTLEVNRLVNCYTPFRTRLMRTTILERDRRCVTKFWSAEHVSHLGRSRLVAAQRSLATQTYTARSKYDFKSTSENLASRMLTIEPLLTMR